MDKSGVLARIAVEAPEKLEVMERPVEAAGAGDRAKVLTGCGAQLCYLPTFGIYGRNTT